MTITTAPKPGIGDRVALFHSRMFDWPQPTALRLLEQLLTTMILGRDQAYLNRPWVEARTIHIEAGEVGLLDFGISPSRREALYQRGYDAASTVPGRLRLGRLPGAVPQRGACGSEH